VVARDSSQEARVRDLIRVGEQERVVFALINIFRDDDQGRLAEEWVQTDNQSRLRELGAEGR
jgi:hypothetical protein